jgi:hypothetical protein
MKGQKMTNQEKLDEMREDMMIENKLRYDYEYCIDFYFENNGALNVDLLMDHLWLYGWYAEREECEQIIKEYNESNI